jgi:hypothetical protein
VFCRRAPALNLLGSRATGIQWGTITSGTPAIGRALRTLLPAGSPLDTTEADTSPGIGTVTLVGGTTTIIGIGIAKGISSAAIMIVVVNTNIGSSRGCRQRKTL